MVPHRIPDEIRSLCAEIEPVGSRVTCSPPPTDTDEDWLLLVSEENYNQLLAIVAVDHVLGGSEANDSGNPIGPDEKFSSYTKGELNLIITDSRAFYRRFMAATSVAKRLNLLRKDDRIALFQAVLYGNDTQNNPLELDHGM